MNTDLVRNSDEFRQRYRQLQADWKARYAPLIAGARAKLTGEAEGVEAAKVEANLLEAHVRVGVVDSLLQGLNWHLDGSRHNMVAEAAVRSEKKGTIRFLDYLGVETSSLTPLMVVETKRPSSMLPTPEDSPRRTQYPLSSTDRWARITTRLSNGLGSERLPGEWGEWLDTLRDYCISVHSRAKVFPRRILVTNGDWLVVFLDPEDAFGVDGGHSPSNIMVCEDSNAVEQNASEIYSLLEYHRVLGRWPILSVGEAPFYISGGDIVKYACGLRLRYSAELTVWGAQEPVLRVAPIVFLLTENGERILIRNGPVDERIPEGEPYLSAHIVSISKATEQLLSQTVAALQLSGSASPLTDMFPLEQQSSNAPILEDGEAGAFVVVTGVASHFLLSDPSIQACPSHRWESCRAGGMAAHDGPITKRSTTTKSFFVDGEAHHCAHRQARDAKASPRSISCPTAFCLVFQFDEFLCCHACCFEVLCRRDERFRPPCPPAARGH